MPIDPTIISQLLGPKPGEFTTPAEDRKVVADARTAKLQAQNQELLVRDNTLKLRAQEDARREEALIRKVAMESGGDWEVIIPKLRQLAPGAAMKYEEQLAKIRKEGFEAQFKANENEKTSIQKALGILRSIGDDATYQQMLPTLRGLNEDLGKMLPAQFDPQRVEQLQQYGITAEKALDLSRQSLQLIADGKLTDGVASALSMADTEQEWNETLHDLQQAGVPKAFLKVFGAWRPNAVQEVLTMAMTPEKRAELDQWTKTYNEGVRRFDKTFQQTQERQDANENYQKGMLGVARTNAATSRMNAVTNQQTASGGGAAGVSDPGTVALAEQIIWHPERFRNLDVGLATRDALTKEFARRGLPVPEVVKFTAGQQKDLALTRQMRASAEELLRVGGKKNWAGTGFGEGPASSKADEWGLLTNPDKVAVRAAIAKLAVAYRKMQSGLAVTGYDVAALAPVLPDVNNSAASIQQKTKALLEELTLVEELIIGGAEQGPKRQGGGPAPTGTTDPAAESAWQTYQRLKGKK